MAGKVQSRRRRQRKSGTPVGVVGLGIMGGAFARHLLAAGHPVTGYDVAAARRRELAGRGGRAARSCADVAKSTRIIITSLPSPAAMAEAFFGKEGIVAGAARGTVVIEASTMPIELKERCRKRFARAGIEMLDCPISGTGAQAAAKDIAVYASGERRAFNRCRKVFDGFARSTYYCGEFGIGSKLKFIANLLVTIHNLSTAEAMVMGEKAGLDLGLVYRVIRDGAGTSRMFEVRGPMMVNGRYLPATMKADVYQKDINIIHAFARRLRCPTPLFDRSLAFYTAALGQGWAKQDTAAIHAILRKRARLRGSASSASRRRQREAAKGKTA
ncbi:MAG: NAD(P)-dependent oxidoreductase [Betaproteobacteria bacterium]|nr:NAD(P)-dependent oxidoreductase [Betaproteobacteria bacterium]